MIRLTILGIFLLLSSKTYAQEVFAVRDSIMKAQQLKEFVAKRDLLEKIIQHFELNSENKRIINDKYAFTLNVLGNEYMRIGELHFAKKLIEKSIRSYTPQNQYYTNVAKTDLGNYYSNQGLWKEAKKHYADMLSSMSLDNPFFEITVAEMIESCLKLNDLDSAEYWLNQVKKKGTDIIATVVPTLLMFEGEIFLMKGNFESAISLFREAETKFENPHEKARLHAKIASDYYLKKEAYDAALEEVNKGFKTFIPDFQASMIESLPKEKQLTPKEELINLFSVKATIFYARYQKKGNLEDLQNALACFEKLIRVENLMRELFIYPQVSQEILKRRHSYLEMAISICHILYEKTTNVDYINLAFQFAENAKNNLLKESFTKLEIHRAKYADFLSGSKRDQAITLSEKVLSLTSEIFYYENNDKLSKQELKNLKKDLATAEANWKNFVGNLPKDDNYYFYKYGRFNVSVDEVQNEFLQEDQALVEYFWGGKHQYAIVINKNKKHFVKLPYEPRDESLINDFLQNLTIENGGGINKKRFKEQARRLYQILIAPIKTYLPKKVFIVPDKEVTLVPFDALLIDNAEGSDWKNSLINHHTTSYLFSAGLSMRLPQKGKDAVKEYLGIAPIDYEGKLNSLKSQDVLDAGIRLFSGDTLLFEKANENAFKERAFFYRIIHLATHAGLDETTFDDPSIYFPKDSLQINEIFNMTDLNAELLILSGCLTNNGKIFTGEGIMSLSRAFAYKKCNSILTNQWNASEKSIPQIIINYFGYLKAGYDKATALNLAKRKYIDDQNGDVNPFYWAGLIQLGDIQPIYKENAWPLSKVIRALAGLSIPLVLFIAYLVFFRRKAY